MVTLIIGQNAIGKSVYLKNKAKSESLTSEIIYNMTDTSYLDNIAYNKERIEQLKDILDTEEIIENKDCLIIQTDEVCMSRDFMKLLTLICKDCSKLYIDDIEYGLEYHQIGFLIWFLSRVEDTFDEIMIVTHSEMLLGIENKEVKTVEYDKASKEFILVDIKDKDYNVID